MVEDKWLLLASIPVVVFLSLSIRRRLRDLNARIEQLKREDAAGPVNPYQAMYEAMAAGPMKPDSTPGRPLPFSSGGSKSMANGSLHLSAGEQSGLSPNRSPEADRSEDPGDTDKHRHLEDNDG